MPDKLVIRGVPPSLAMDGWWLSGDIGRPPPATSPSGTARRIPPALALLALIALGDYLFWDRDLGLSVVVFALATFLIAATDRMPGKALFKPLALLILGALPALDYVQALSLAFLIGALILSLVWVRAPHADLHHILPNGFGFCARFPRRILSLPRAVINWPSSAHDPASDIKNHLRLWGRNWAFPLGGALVFAALLIKANPVFEHLLTPDLELDNFLPRLMLWLGLAFLVWPFLETAPLSRRQTLRRPALPSLGLNRDSVWRALIVFNLLIAVQTGLDLSILVGGADLPTGMSHATYAHRGAYPLLATALLAGCFALIARPFLDENRFLRPLMVLWLVQNVALCGAALLRLDLYVDAYGLTYLRLHAQIWMLVVACCLAFAIWQVAFRRSNSWLMARAATLGLAVLYGASFVNFAHIIAARNLTMAEPDYYYICSLGPMTGITGAELDPLPYGPAALCGTTTDTDLYWQEWGFRKWRMFR